MTPRIYRVFPMAAVAGALVALATGRASAQDGRLSLIRDDATRNIVRLVLGSASASGLPVDPLISKALEGVAKKASPSSIRDAMNALEKRMRRANDLLGPDPTVDELAAGADALYVGVPEKTLRQMRALAPRRSIALELGVLTELVARKVPTRQASKMVLDLMARSATGAQLTALSGAVQSDVAAGLKPEVALEVHGRATLSLLPPPAPVSAANGRPPR
jgi:hypothetical protein